MIFELFTFKSLFSRDILSFTNRKMPGKAPIVKEYKRAGSFFGVKGTRLLRVVTTFLTIGICFIFNLIIKVLVIIA